VQSAYTFCLSLRRVGIAFPGSNWSWRSSFGRHPPFGAKLKPYECGMFPPPEVSGRAVSCGFSVAMPFREHFRRLETLFLISWRDSVQRVVAMFRAHQGVRLVSMMAIPRDPARSVFVGWTKRVL